MQKIRRTTESGSPSSEHSPSAPSRVDFRGRYEREGSSLCRQSDGLLLLFRSRSELDTARPGLYLMLKGPDGKFRYVSSVYRNGSEFEDRGSATRYHIDADPTDARFVVISSIGRPTRRVVASL